MERHGPWCVCDGLQFLHSCHQTSSRSVPTIGSGTSKIFSKTITDEPATPTAKGYPAEVERSPDRRMRPKCAKTRRKPTATRQSTHEDTRVHDRGDGVRARRSRPTCLVITLTESRHVDRIRQLTDRVQVTWRRATWLKPPLFQVALGRGTVRVRCGSPVRISNIDIESIS